MVTAIPYNSGYIFSCGVKLVAMKNCMDAGQDMSLPYPDCCKRYKCKMDGKVFYL